MASESTNRTVTQASAGEPNPNGPLLALLKLEADAREAATLDELRYLISTESRKLTQARQCFVFGLSHRKSLRLEAISGLTFVERDAPLTMAIEDVVRLRTSVELLQKIELDIKSYNGQFREFASDYPFPYLLWMPFLNRQGHLLGGMLLVREKPWTEGNIVVSRRLAQTFAHAVRELNGVRRRPARPNMRLGLTCAAVAGALVLIRVPVTAMAPFEIVPRNAQLIAAPLDGTIEHVLVAPGAAVTEGQLLLRFSGATLESRLDIAQHEVLVAEANLKQAAQLAFTEDRGRRDLATASSQVELKVAERDLARQLLSRTEVRAQKSGISMFTSPDDLIGRPVATGEKLMKVADPDQVEASLEVSLTDASLLQNGTHVRLFFDADPLNAQDAVLESAEYKPKPDASNVLSYRAVASLVGESLRPRLGARGTAQLVGHSASLAFVLLRRPLAALRQRIAM